MPGKLTITPAPYKSSHLAIPPSPFSPQYPITPLRTTSPPRRAPSPSTRQLLDLTPAPSDPLKWLWQCHICNRVYQLGITRRCLDDGHYFCAGTTTVKRSRRTNKKVVRHKACASEFDYQGWKSWGTWRRSAVEQMAAAEALLNSSNEDDNVVLPLHVPTEPTEGQWLNGMWAKKGARAEKTADLWHKDCWNTCDYPSECRWGKQYGVQTPVVATNTPTVPSTPAPAIPEKSEKRAAKTTFDDILRDASDTENSTAEHMQHPVVVEQNTTPPTGEHAEAKKPSMDDLLESVKRRKRKSDGQMPSPLSSNPPSPTMIASEAADALEAQTPGEDLSSTANYLQKAFDDFELDVKKSLERASGLVTGWAKNGVRNDQKAELFAVKALRISKKKQADQ